MAHGSREPAQGPGAAVPPPLSHEPLAIHDRIIHEFFFIGIGSYPWMRVAGYRCFALISNASRGFHEIPCSQAENVRPPVTAFADDALHL